MRVELSNDIALAAVQNDAATDWPHLIWKKSIGSYLHAVILTLYTMENTGSNVASVLLHWSSNGVCPFRAGLVFIKGGLLMYFVRD